MTAIRPYKDRDRDDVVRIWQEVGWIDDSERQVNGLHALLVGGDALVAEISDHVECFVHRSPASVRYLDDDMTLSIISAVTTSRVARRLGLATSMTARLIAAAAMAGAEVSILGMFEQGFYNRLGFGTGSETDRFTFDPSTLTVPIPARSPVRLTLEDAGEIHDLMTRAERIHGGVLVQSAQSVVADLHLYDKLVVLGLRDEDGLLSGVLAGSTMDTGGARISMLVGSTPDDVLDLLGVIRSLSDQWATVVLDQPPSLQLQDLIDRPLRQRDQRRQSSGAEFHNTIAWSQVRILDLPAAIGRVRWHGEPFQFALRLDDPISEMDDLEWAGLAGEWVLTLGAESTAERGSTTGVPVLSCGIGSLSRMWLGVRPPSVLARTTDIVGPDDLLHRLDRGLLVPVPNPGVNF